MKKAVLIQLSLLVFILLSFTGCEVVEGIFKVGLWVGIVSVIVVIALIFLLVKKLF